MNCAEKLFEPKIFNLFTKSLKNFGSQRHWRKRDLHSTQKFRYQIIVSSILLRHGFVKFMIPIALFKEFLSQQFIASVDVSNMAICSNKTNELRNIDSIGCRARNITI